MIVKLYRKVMYFLLTHSGETDKVLILTQPRKTLSRDNWISSGFGKLIDLSKPKWINGSTQNLLSLWITNWRLYVWATKKLKSDARKNLNVGRSRELLINTLNIGHWMWAIMPGHKQETQAENLQLIMRSYRKMLLSNWDADHLFYL